eukprot:TRINITY_DN7219_c0_g4_i1.p1 TRINITY_DN7219_c0_g4~~TRINITY_DN7219_c0_g4_i1.p1  ORF type:complete len:575 (+),score=184.22 TRINITY_DN7219_c0_g4_i1:101-1726(+)
MAGGTGGVTAGKKVTPKLDASKGKTPSPPSLTLAQQGVRREPVKKTVARNRSRTPGGETAARGSSVAKRSVTPQGHKRSSSSTPNGGTVRTPQGKTRHTAPRSISPAVVRGASSSPIFIRRPQSHSNSGYSQDSSRSASVSLQAQVSHLKQQLHKVTQERDSLKLTLRHQLERAKTRPGRTAPDSVHGNVLEGINADMVTNFGIVFSDLKIDRDAILGSGGFGTVYKGDYQATDVAVKVHRSDKDWSEEELVVWRREVKIMSMLRHPNVLMLLGAVFEKSKLAIITEFCESGTLQELFLRMMQGGEKLSWARKMKWMMQIAKGMAFLHHKRIFHRDLKSANVFVTSDCMKIADFGLSKISHHAPEASQNGRASKAETNDSHRPPQSKGTSLIQGTFAFMAPEVWAEESYTEACDVYSFGVLMTELMAGDIPFERDFEDDCSWRIMTYRSRPKVLKEVGGQAVPPGTMYIQTLCLSKPKVRPTFTELVALFRKEMEKPYSQLDAPFPDAQFDPWVGVSCHDWPSDKPDPLSESEPFADQPAR